MKQVNIESKISGKYRIFKKNKKNEITYDSGWFHNLVTNYGLDEMATSNAYAQYCRVGTGSSTPANSDTLLNNQIASTQATFQASNVNRFSSAPYGLTFTRYFSFGSGGAVGNISEVGVGSTPSGSLFSRALILDGGGNPTSITILSDETLYVVYQLTFYAPVSDITGSITLDGVVYNYVSRASGVTGSSFCDATFAENYTKVSGPSYTHASTYDITDVTGTPKISDTSWIPSASAATYVNGNHYVDITFTFALTIANGNIKSIFGRMGTFSYQVGFTPAIPKTSDKVLTLTFRHSWGRA